MHSIRMGVKEGRTGVMDNELVGGTGGGKREPGGGPNG